MSLGVSSLGYIPTCKGETDVTVNSGDHTVRLLGGCIWTYSG